MRGVKSKLAPLSLLTGYNMYDEADVTSQYASLHAPNDRRGRRTRGSTDGSCAICGSGTHDFATAVYSTSSAECGTAVWWGAGVSAAVACQRGCGCYEGVWGVGYYVSEVMLEMMGVSKR